MGTTITAGCASRGSQNSRSTRLDRVTGEVHGPIVIGKSPRRRASDLRLSNPSTRRLQTHLLARAQSDNTHQITVTSPRQVCHRV